LDLFVFHQRISWQQTELTAAIDINNCHYLPQTTVEFEETKKPSDLGDEFNWNNKQSAEKQQAKEKPEESKVRTLPKSDSTNTAIQSPIAPAFTPTASLSSPYTTVLAPPNHMPPSIVPITSPHPGTSTHLSS